MQGASHAWEVGDGGKAGDVEGNGKIYLEGEKTDIVAVTEDDRCRQCQIHAKRKVEISKEKESMNRNGKNRSVCTRSKVTLIRRNCLIKYIIWVKVK